MSRPTLAYHGGQQNHHDLIERMRQDLDTGARADLQKVAPPVLDSVDDLRRVANAAFLLFQEKQGYTPEMRDKAMRDGHQVVLTRWAPPAEGYLGKVTERSWNFIVTTMLRQKHMEHTQRKSGKWVLAHAAIDTVMREYSTQIGGGGDEYIEGAGMFNSGDKDAVGVRRWITRHLYIPLLFVEISGTRPHVYSEKDGEVITQQQVIDPAMLAEMRAMGGDRSALPPGTTDVAAENADLKARLAALEEMIHKVVEGRETQKPSPDADPAPPPEAPADDVAAKLEKDTANSDGKRTGPWRKK